MNKTTKPTRTIRPTITPSVQPSIINENYGLPTTPLMNALGQGPTVNSQSNVIAGPRAKDYWDHDLKFEEPEIPEEGAFPIQGSIGSLVANEGLNQFANCTYNVDGVKIPSIGSGPNCGGTFREDLYTKKNTCGAECATKYPESFGDKDFGFPDNMPWSKKVTDAHQTHAYQNIRAGLEGQGPSNELDCYEWVPRISPDKQTGTCIMNQEPAYNTVGDWTKLPMYNNLTKVKWSSK